MKNSFKIKLISLLLAFVTVLSFMISCGEDGPSGKPDDTNDREENVNGTNVTESETETTALDLTVLNIPEENFDEYEFTIFTGEPEYVNFRAADFDEPSDDAYENALYRRNLEVEELLNVKISELAVDNKERAKIFTTLVTSGDESINIAFLYTMQAAEVVFSGLCQDIKNFNYISLESDWWDQASIEQLSLGDKTYMVAGELLYSDKECLWIELFIKSVIAEYGLESPYQLVYDGEWTFDKMYEMMQIVSHDVDGNGMMNGKDMLGFVTHNESYPGLWIAAGQKLITINESGYPEMTWQSEEFVNIYEKIQTIMGSKDDTLNNMGVIVSSMMNRFTLFVNAVISDIKGSLRNSEHDFGIIPLPKYDKDQKEYYTMAAYASDLMVIGNNNVEHYIDGVITEALAYYGKEIMLPAYYDKQITYRYLRDEDSGKMLDIIFKNRVYDLGVLSGWGKVSDSLKSSTANAATTWAESSGAMQSEIDAAMEKLMQ